MTGAVGIANVGALITDNREEGHIVYRIDKSGSSMTMLYSSKEYIARIILLPSTRSHVLVLSAPNIITRVRLHDGKLLEQLQINVEDLTDGIAIDDNNLLLVDSRKGGIYSYNMLQRQGQFVVHKLRKVSSVAMAPSLAGPVYLVCVAGFGKINLYNSKWQHQRTIGEMGTKNGNFSCPNSVVVLLDNKFLVADYGNDRVSQFTLDGQFCCHILEKKDGIVKPTKLSYCHPYLWVIYECESGKFNAECFKL